MDDLGTRASTRSKRKQPTLLESTRLFTKEHEHLTTTLSSVRVMETEAQGLAQTLSPLPFSWVTALRVTDEHLQALLTLSILPGLRTARHTLAFPSK